MTLHNEKVTEYLDSLDATGVVRERTRKYIDLYSELLQNPPYSRIFINDLVDEDGDRRFGSLWLISQETVSECPDLEIDTPTSKWDFAQWGIIKHIELETQNYSPTSISPASRMTLEWANDSNIAGKMSATGENCKVLTDILSSHILPRMHSGLS